jgi:ABC-type transport system involved in multi-copper enzyme maturation permease subunit
MTYLWGKLAGIGLALAMILAASFALSVVSLAIVNGVLPSLEEVGRLALFFVLSLAYMLLFALVGVITALVVQGRSLALLVALGVWMFVTFMVPQFTSGLRPTASLNPVVDPVNTTQRFFEVTSHLRSLSISEQYRGLSAAILQTAPDRAMSDTMDQVATIGVLLVGLLVAVAVLVNRLDISERGSYE